MAHRPGLPSSQPPLPPRETQYAAGWATRRFSCNRLIYDRDDPVTLEYHEFKTLLEAGVVTQEQPWTPPPVPPKQPEPPVVQQEKPLPKGKLEKASQGLANRSASAGTKAVPNKLETHDLQARLEKLNTS